jgi:outer membrane assembly lipoprotein YfiO
VTQAVHPWPARGAFCRQRHSSRRLAVCLVAALAFGCGHPGKQFPAGSLERGQAEFEGKRWAQAVETLKQFIRRNPRDARADDAQFLIGQTYMGAREYPLAAVEFEILRNDYPLSELVDDAYFLEGIAYARQRPNYRLDQKVTHRALEHLRRYLTQFPTGKHRDEVQAEILALQGHLDFKRLEQARQYIALHRLEAAAIVIDGLLEASAESPQRPDALLLRGQVADRLGHLAEALEFWSELVERYPDHQAASRARRLLRDLGAASVDTAGGGPPGSGS